MPLPPDIERVLVIGLGKVTGRAVAEALLEQGLEVRVTEAAETDDHLRAASDLSSRGVEVSFGPPSLDLVEWANLIVPSPGVPPANPLLAEACSRGTRIWSEIELGWRLGRSPVLAVTGTNGKTTTTTLLAKVLEAGEIPSAAVGNIGFPLVRAATTLPPETTLVCEVSSFQLAFIETFRPGVAIVLNVADDHYDWHEGYDDYLRAKGRITENQTEDDLLVVAVDDPGCLRIAESSRATLAGFGLGPPADLRKQAEERLGRPLGPVAGAASGRIVIDSGGQPSEVAEVREIRMRGAHNVENVLAALLAARWCGVSDAAFTRVARSFDNLPHRMSVVAEIDGVTYIDDSKATNPHATLKAMTGLDRVVWIAGGRAKGLDLSALRSIKPQLSGMVVMGEAASDLEKLFDDVPREKADSVEDAVAVAARMARPGDTVLLSPACSSLDQYVDYAERGRRFAEAVRSR
ncbi:MAG: UDP-N-acetylmuramoyl-L-alanine--D-glutamate ligase [Actinomycetota bacterium]|nr:UDP-N-acetylmuramoyl-L-alanine--D-glutamate ligase [Actinomycetota bacterium]